MRKYDTVIFDLDGTLLSTLEDLRDSVNYALARFGYTDRTLSEVRDFVGNGVARLMELSIPGGTQNPDYGPCLEEFRRHYALNMRNKTKPYDGIMELLGVLSGEGYKLAVVSNKFDAAVKALCRDYFGDFIAVAIGESAGVSKKPAPDAVFAALKQLESTPDRALYVGDSEVDAETAKNAGLPLVGVTWGFRDRNVLQQKGADYIIDEPSDLLSIVCPNL